MTPEQEAKCKEACGTSEPSAGHDWIDEVTGLLRVTRMQRDGFEKELLECQKKLNQLQRGDQAAKPPSVLMQRKYAKGN